VIFVTKITPRHKSHGNFPTTPSRFETKEPPQGRYPENPASRKNQPRNKNCEPRSSRPPSRSLQAIEVAPPWRAKGVGNPDACQFAVWHGKCRSFNRDGIARRLRSVPIGSDRHVLYALPERRCLAFAGVEPRRKIALRNPEAFGVCPQLFVYGSLAWLI
jgi:hypothetical protein